MALLDINHVDVIYQSEKSETEAVRDLTLSVDEGEFIALVGPSGCGKTTLLSMIAGLLTPTHGSVTIDGEPIVASGGNVGYMLQRDNLFEWRTIESNVLLGLSIQRSTRPTCLTSTGSANLKTRSPLNCPAVCANAPRL